MKGTRLDAIHENLVHRLGKEALASFTVTKNIRNAPFVPKTEAVTPEPAEGRHGPVDQVILAALGKYPFPYMRELSRLTWLSVALSNIQRKTINVLQKC
jgi:hypothetical protein